jgi:hypothetical protein
MWGSLKAWLCKGGTILGSVLAVVLRDGCHQAIKQTMKRPATGA